MNTRNILKKQSFIYKAVLLTEPMFMFLILQKLLKQPNCKKYHPSKFIGGYNGTFRRRIAFKTSIGEIICLGRHHTCKCFCHLTYGYHHNQNKGTLLCKTVVDDKFLLHLQTDFQEIIDVNLGIKRATSAK